jgi:hypothetical protein
MLMPICALSAEDHREGVHRTSACIKVPGHWYFGSSGNPERGFTP